MQTTPTITISPTVANQVLDHFGRGGYPASSWAHKLITLMACADRDNLAKLATGFPEYAAAVDMAKYDRLGIENLQRLARAIECAECGDVDGPFARRADGSHVCEAHAA